MRPAPGDRYAPYQDAPADVGGKSRLIERPGYSFDRTDLTRAETPSSNVVLGTYTISGTAGPNYPHVLVAPGGEVFTCFSFPTSGLTFEMSCAEISPEGDLLGYRQEVSGSASSHATTTPMMALGQETTANDRSWYVEVVWSDDGHADGKYEIHASRFWIQADP